MALVTAEEIERSMSLHTSLVEWLVATHPLESPIVIVMGLTYEIGRLLGLGSEGSSPEDVDRTIASITAAMRHHIEMYRQRESEETRH